jgi:hypothetical protein
MQEQIGHFAGLKESLLQALDKGGVLREDENARRNEFGGFRILVVNQACVQQLLHIVHYRIDFRAKALDHSSLIVNTQEYNTIQYNTIQYNAIQYNTTQSNKKQNNTIQYDSMQYNTLQ